MSRPFVIRDADGRVIDALGSAPLLSAIARPGLDRIDLWPRGPRGCTVGFAWADGASGIGDLPWSADALTAWLQQRNAASLVRHHLGRKSA